jgi:dipeptidase E
MKLYLSSVGIPDTRAFLKLFGKHTPRTAAIIPTAWHSYPTEKSAPFIAATSAEFTKMGFTYKYVDLKDFDGKKDELRAKLSDFSALWVLGGNTFLLNYWMRQSGFDEIIRGLLANGTVYGGESAGAVVAGKTLHGIELLDNPADAPEVLWEGLNLVDYGVIPHWGVEKYAGRAEQSYEEMQQFCKVKTLKNDERITVL